MKTKNNIDKIITKSEEKFSNTAERIFWLNYYSPYIDFEDMCLVPILYVIFLPFFLATIMSFYWPLLIPTLYILWLIIYDIAYKIKIKNKLKNGISKNEIKEWRDQILNNNAKISIWIEKILPVVGCFVFTALCIYIFINAVDGKFIIIPFIICGIGMTLKTTADFFGNYNFSNLFSKFYIIGFLLFWFGFLIFATFFIIKNEGNYLLTLALIPFWIVEIVITIKSFKK